MTETMMRAISQDVLGGPEVLKETAVPRPAPGPTEVLVRVHAAGVNPTDWKHRATGGQLGRPPYVLGWDVSGVVESVGVGTALYRPGDEVFGMLRYPYGHGAFAEYVAAPARTFARKPRGIDHVQAAALPLAALTAWQALVDTAGVEAGQRVLIHAAAGGVGHLAVQIAKARGAHVIGTASAAKHAFLRGLGADELIDYRSVDFAEVVGDVDVVIDTMGGDYGPRSLRTLRRGGVIVSLVLSDLRPGLHAQAEELGVRSESMLVEPDHAALKAIAALVEEGGLRVEIDTVLPLEQAAKAHELGETGRTTGKIVLTVEPSTGR
ncbi:MULTISPECIES: NADP-dependent oxidoreductase [Streptosporangium]|uniref:NADPH:quinone reductase-like Zn-dependent oxidoreductase n=1 Tax=Streptosporangium brasiliense TaxID=47480 RepID=A0ABT9R2J1_9ACTN|nr:NADP-dependent oxidoreductase [Streptosporangium brasiliense]MDP9863445.1 NADPH:quinone reductase-like Zn-dependent oxidoreductase [Streptosporangium brasiliense]